MEGGSGWLLGEEMEGGSGWLHGEEMEGGSGGCIKGDSCWEDPDGCKVRR